MYRDTTNVEPEMYDYTSNNWSYWNSNEKLKEKFSMWFLCNTKVIISERNVYKFPLFFK